MQKVIVTLITEAVVSGGRLIEDYKREYKEGVIMHWGAESVKVEHNIYIQKVFVFVALEDGGVIKVEPWQIKVIF